MARNLKQKIETVKDVGDDTKKFLNDTLVENEMSEMDIAEAMKRKKLGEVTIKISVRCGKIPTTVFQDDFKLILTTDREDDNTKVITGKLGNASNQIKKLINRWTREVN